MGRHTRRYPAQNLGREGLIPGGATQSLFGSAMRVNGEVFITRISIMALVVRRQDVSTQGSERERSKADGSPLGNLQNFDYMPGKHY